MELNLFQSILFGLFSGLAEILPVSAPAHRAILMKLFGESGDSPLLSLMVHIATVAALYYSCHTQILRLLRAQKLAAVPKRRRKRPLDTNSLMDIRVLRTTLIPIILGFVLYPKVSSWGSNLLILGLLLLVNGVILYIPPYMPGSNKKSATMSRLDGFLMGLGGGLSVLPGISSIGTSTSIASVCGVDRQYALNTALLMNIPVTIGFIVFDFVAMFTAGVGSISFGFLFSCILAAAATFGGVYLAVKVMRGLAVNIGFSCFAYYSWGSALLAMFLYIII